MSNIFRYTEDNMAGAYIFRIPGVVSIKALIIIVVVAATIFGFIGYLIGSGKILKRFPASITFNLDNMDRYMIRGSLILLIFSICLSVLDDRNALAVILLNIFSSIVFSWLLTKRTSIKDFKEKEEELALRSYRHINYIESAANTASGKIDKYISENAQISTEMQLILASAKEQIKYVQGGINTCKMDWFDLLSEEEKNKHAHDGEENDDFGTVDTVISDEDINQEDA